GSMAAGVPQTERSRIEMVRDALINLAEQLRGHDGVINLAVIGFASHVTLQISQADLDSDGIDRLLAQLAQLSPEHFDYSRGIMYLEGFEAASACLPGRPSEGPGIVPFLLPYGDPIQYTTPAGQLTGSSLPTAGAVQQAIASFAALAGQRKVRAI